MRSNGGILRVVESVLIVALGLATSGPPADAEEPKSASQPVGPLSSEVEELRRENARLRVELEKLKRELAEKEESRRPPEQVPREAAGPRPIRAPGALERAELSPHEVRRLLAQQREILSVVVTADGKYVLSSAGDCTVCLWDLATGKVLQTQPAPERARATDFVRQIALSPDGTLAAFAAGQYPGTQRVVLWDIANWQQKGTWEGHTGPVKSVAFTPEGTWLASGGADGTVRLTDLRNLTAGRVIKTKHRQVEALAVSPDGKQAVTGSSDHVDLQVWDLKSGKLIREISNVGQVASLAYTRDGRFFLSAGSKLIQWDARTGQNVRNWLGHTGAVRQVTMATDGKHFATAGHDCSVRLWAFGALGEIGRFDGHEKPVAAVAFTPDGTHLVSGSDDRSIRVWKLEVGEKGADPFARDELPQR